MELTVITYEQGTGKLLYETHQVEIPDVQPTKWSKLVAILIEKGVLTDLDHKELIS